MKKILVALAVAILSACSGGSGDSSNPAPSPTPTPLPVKNAAPIASAVKITGNNGDDVRNGDLLTGSYQYSDKENNNEGVSIYRWLRTRDDITTSIDNAVTKTYQVLEADEGADIVFEVTPVALSGTLQGSAIESAAISVTTSVAPQVDFYKHLDGRDLTQAEKTEIDNRVLDSAIKPDTGHPRLYGGEQWNTLVTNIESFDSDCNIGYINADRGSVINFKSMWDRVLYGRSSCGGALNSDLSQHNDAKRYYGVVDTTREEQEVHRLRVLHLIRREIACHDSDIEIACQFSAADRDALIQKFYDAEITRLRTAPRFDPTNPYQVPMWGGELGFPANYTFNKRWHRSNSAQFMVLEAAPAFKFWTLFLDILWDHSVLKPEDKAYVEAELNYEIDSYLKQYEEKHWTLFNGNNWTAVLNSAALHWVVLNYYEQPIKAKKVLSAILESNWTHRDFYQQDGGYKEGGSYAIGTSYPYILTQHQLFMGAFKQPIHSFNWLLGEKLSSWLLNNVLSDSYLADFGDAHATQGTVSTMPLDLLLARSMLPNTNTDYPAVLEDANL